MAKPFSMSDNLLLNDSDIASKYQPVTIENLYIQNKTTMIYITKDLNENVSPILLIFS